MDGIIRGIIEVESIEDDLMEGFVKVHVDGSIMELYLPNEEVVSIYTASGLLYEEKQMPAGKNRMNLTKGTYLLKIGGKSYKAICI